MKVNFEPEWSRAVIASHAPLFQAEFLLEMGEHFRQQHLGKGTKGQKAWPEIPAGVCNFPQSVELAEGDKCWGFDLPLLFTPDKWNGKNIAIVSQDPLRTPTRDGNRFTVATPWGLSNRADENKASNKRFRPTIDMLLERGYGVYLTDKSKLYFHATTGAKLASTRDIEVTVLRDEIRSLNPSLCISFGGQAAGALSDFWPCGALEKLPHPTAWAQHQCKFYGTDSAKHDVIAAAMREKVEARLATLNQLHLVANC